ncbi:MAG TPA: zinc ribbon domain-containing protein [Pyrinomonadaceae bacterium]|nr:zinc ribbon domain-containing protein [Pyrinomonadaceae bacterium]
MYCPNCGQQQISDEMRFCSRCGLALSGLVEWLAGGRLPLQRRDEPQAPAANSPRRKGMRRAAKLMFFSGVLFFICLVISIAAEEGAFMVFPFLLFFISLALMLYARLFSDTKAPVINQPAQTPAVGSTSARGSLPPGATIPIPGTGRQHVRTNELAQPSSVTENTTRLLDNE